MVKQGNFEMFVKLFAFKAVSLIELVNIHGRLKKNS